MPQGEFLLEKFTKDIDKIYQVVAMDFVSVAVMNSPENLSLVWNKDLSNLNGNVP